MNGKFNMSVSTYISEHITYPHVLFRGGVLISAEATLEIKKNVIANAAK